MKRCKPPGNGFGHLEKSWDPEKEVATHKLYDKFHDFPIPPNSNPIEALHALEDTNDEMAEKEMGIPDTFLHAHFVRALPAEYSRSPEQAFFSSESGGRSGARRGLGHGRGGTQGCDRGGSSSKGGGNEAAEAPVVPALIAMVAVADLLAAVGDEREEVTLGRSAPRKRATLSPSVLSARVSATRRAHAHRTRRCQRWSCRCQKRISPWKLRRS